MSKIIAIITNQHLPVNPKMESFKYPQYNVIMRCNDPNFCIFCRVIPRQSDGKGYCKSCEQKNFMNDCSMLPKCSSCNKRHM